MTLQDFLTTKYGYKKEINDNWQKYIKLWKSWYQGKVKGFHRYRVYNGNHYNITNRLSMQMAKKACEDWADLLFNERCTISLANEDSNRQLLEVLTDNDFWQLTNESIERSGSVGTGAIVTSVVGIEINDDSGIIDLAAAETRLEYVDINWIFPISWSGSAVKECAFGAKQTIKGKNYIYLTVHLLENGKYVIFNHVFEDVNGNLKEIPNDSTLARFDTGSDTKWFAFLRPAGVNSIYPSSPWGMPYYANSIDTLQALDLSFDALSKEVELGRMRAFAREDMFNFGVNGQVNVFDPADALIYVLPERQGNAEDKIQVVAPALRIDQIKTDIELNLNIYSEQVGFGQGHYQFTQNGVQTATGVISNNSAMFRRKKKHETALESALYDIVKSVIYASTAFGHYNISDDGLVIQMDDSIIEDKESQSARALREISSGVLSPVEYRVKIFGESPEIAEKAIEDIKNNNPTMQQLIADGE